MKLEVGVPFFQLPEELRVIIEAELRVVAALQQELLSSQCKSLFDLLAVLLQGGYVALFMAGPAKEVAELAVGDANIGGIGIAVNDPGDHISRHMVLPEAIANKHELCRGGILEEENAFFCREVFQVEGFLKQVVDTHNSWFD